MVLCQAFVSRSRWPTLNLMMAALIWLTTRKGHCVCNLGDAMVKFTAGILRSNIHRVVNPPGEQGDSTRISVVYFSRPEDPVILKVLEGSEMIDEKRKHPVEFAGEEYLTSKEWTIRRAMGRRVGGDWQSTLGTEGSRLSN